MPFLRGEGGAGTHELRSSKTLIGASPSKCDVVVRRAGVLDLHALLSLSPDKSSGTIVPFSSAASAAGSGACYLNDRVVPVQGLPVVHGDRIAFGDPATSFTFQLTAPPSSSLSPQQQRNADASVNASSSSTTASFRRALDALRGDRAVTSPHAATRASKQKPSADARRSQAAGTSTTSGSVLKSNSKSREQLGRFLLDASSDLMLSEYVERKLRQSASRRRSTAPRMAMEPPPSLSASSASLGSVQSLSQSISLEDSILNRPSRTVRASVDGDDQYEPSLTTSERNVAEVEKLRLSQQLRQVNSQLIDQTLRHKRREIITQAFVRWRRGLRIQSQHRQQRAQQFHKLTCKLLELRRNAIFLQWRALASVTSQAMSCRLDAFQARAANRRLLSVWTQWKLRHASRFQHRRLLLRSVLLRIGLRATQKAFFTWTLRTCALQHQTHLADRERKHQEKWKLRSDNAAESHYTRRILVPLLSTVFRHWRSFSMLQMRKLRVLKKLSLRGAARLKLNGWGQWRHAVALSRHTDAMQKQHAAQMRGIRSQTSEQQQQQQAKMQEAHATALRELEQQLRAKDDELLEIQRREQKKDKELRGLQQQMRESERRKTKQKQEWSQSLESYFESAVARCDRQISQVSCDLEQILQHAEESVSEARFVAARVLVETMLEQKVHSSNERTETQEALLAQLSLMSQQHQQQTPQPMSFADASAPPLSNNAKFLHDMVQQRLTRLHQLLGAIAKLAAAIEPPDDPQQQQQQQLDPVKLRHSTFLTDAILQREQRHVQDMTAILFKLSHCGSKDTAAPFSPPAATA